MFTRKTLIFVVAAVLALTLAACGSNTTPTGTDTDAGAAGSYLPTVNGYTVTEADSITSAITAAAGEGAEALSNPMIEQAVASVDGFIECYSEVGATAANIYTQVNLGSLLSGNLVPSVGAVAVVNQDRVRENFVACAVQSTGFSAMSAGPEICRSSGNFTANEDTFTYIYISTDAEFCAAVETHFGQY